MATFILFIAILLVVVLVHEFGHFLAAKLAGVRVDEFGFGFPPRIFGARMGETVYSLNLLPFGGFVKIAGENAEEGAVQDPRALHMRPRYIQAEIIAAGVIFNILLAWLLISAGLVLGLPTSVSNAPEGSSIADARIVLTDVKVGSPAERAGLLPGDEIVYISTANESLAAETLTVEAVQSFIASSDGREIFIGFRRGEAQTQSVAMEPAQGILADSPAIGIGLDKIGILRLNPFVALVEGASMTYSITVETAKALGSLATSAFKGEFALSSVTGPVGIIGLVGTASTFGFAYLAAFTALLSINLALINLIPFPALDGGRLAILAIEAVKRSPLNPKIVGLVNTVGFVFLLGLMAIVTFHDLTRLF